MAQSAMDAALAGEGVARMVVWSKVLRLAWRDRVYCRELSRAADADADGDGDGALGLSS